MAMDNKYMKTMMKSQALKELDKFFAKLNKNNRLVCMHGGGFHSPNKPNAK